MRILSWNINGHGRQGRDRRLLAAIEDQRPAVVALNEYKAMKFASLLDGMMAAGWSDVAVATAGAAWGAVAVLSRVAITPRPTLSALGEWSHRCVVVDLPDADLTLWAVHAPDGKAAIPPFWETLLAALAEERHRRVLLVGDLNAGARGADMTKRLDGNPFYSRLLGLGYVDLWRHTHGPTTWDYSWKRTVHPYRIDHAIGSSSLVPSVAACEYRHDEARAEPKTERLSDHSMLLVDLVG